jgi:hypothetical protein
LGTASVHGPKFHLFWWAEQEMTIKISHNQRCLIFATMLACSMVACNLLNIVQGSSTPTLQTTTVTTGPTLTPAETTPKAEETFTSTPEGENIPTEIPPNITASGIRVTQVSGYIDTFESLEVVGVVQNQTDRGVDMIEVEIQVLDAGENVIYTDKTFTALDHLAPGEESPFSLTVYEDLAGADSYSAYVVGNGTIDDLIRSEVSVNNVQMTIDKDGDIYITGELVNDNDFPVMVNSMAAATFSDINQIVTANYHSVLTRYLGPGQNGYFRVTMSGPISGPDIIDSYQLYVDAIQSDPLELASLSITTTNAYIDFYGNYHLVGEVTNLGDSHYNFDLTAGVYDTQGFVIDAASVTLAQETLAPDETAPFDFNIWGPLNYNPDLIDTIESHSVVIDDAWTWSTKTGMVNLSTLENAREDSEEALNFSGKIVNSTNSTVDSAVIVVALRDYQSDTIIATNFDYYYEELEPGATYDYLVEIPLWEGIDLTSIVVDYIVKGTKP